MNLKGILMGSALALASQGSAEAAKPLPCPGNSLLVDNIGAVKAATKTKMENRLRSLDKDMHHQVMLLTVNSLEEYGYGSMMEFANAVGNGCGVGYRGENTGVIVLYTKTPSRYRINPADTQRYITDHVSKKIIAKSKSEGVCEKEDVDCRLDFITSEVEKVIRNEFKGPEGAKPLREATKKFDEAKAATELSNLLNNIGMSAVVIVVLGGAAFGAYKGIRLRQRNSRRKELKREILELYTSLSVEKQKYPEWFQKEYINRSEAASKEMMSLTDEQLNDILEGIGRKPLPLFKRDIENIKGHIASWKDIFDKTVSNKDIFLEAYKSQVAEATRLSDSLEKRGFKVGKINITSIDDTQTPIDVISQVKNASAGIGESLKFLKGVPAFYESVKGLDVTMDKELQNYKKKYDETTLKHKDIFSKVTPFDFAGLGIEVKELSAVFTKAYSEKEIIKLDAIHTGSKFVFNGIKKLISDMEKEIAWYESIPSLISSRERQLKSVNNRDEYAISAQKYASKTGKREYQGYDMGGSILSLSSLLAFASNAYSKKENLNQVNGKLSEFDKEYSRMEEYIGLGAALAAIIAAELAEAERLRLVEEKRLKDAREAEERRIKQEEEDEREETRRAESRTSSNDDNPTPGGGEGFNGAGVEDD